MLVVVHQGPAQVAVVSCGVRLFEPFELQLDELPAELNLRRAARRKNQIADMSTSLQHGGDELRSIEFALRGALKMRSLRWCYLCRSSHRFLNQVT